MIIAATGHRPQKLGNEWDGKGPISSALYQRFQQIFHEMECSEAISGMALGVDMLFAEAAIGMHVPVTAAIPFIGQEKVWPQKSKDRYNKILSITDPLVKKVIVCEGGYDASKMQIRNEWMVNNSDLLVAVFDGTKGGTFNCVKYAERVGKQLILINPKTLS